MDRAEEIIDELKIVCESLGMPVEIDRRFDLDGDEMPLAVIRTGDEESAWRDSDPSAVWFRRWLMRPSVEISIREPRTALQTAAANAIWMGFIAAFRDSKLNDKGLLATASKPTMLREVELPDEGVEFVRILITLELHFERK